MRSQPLHATHTPLATRPLDNTNPRTGSITKAPEEAIKLVRKVIDKVDDDPEHQETAECGESKKCK